MSSTGVLCAKKRRFAELVSEGKTYAEAAESIGVSERTATRYASDPLVVEALRQAQDASFAQVARRMASGADDMLDVLHEVATDKSVAAG